MGAVKVGIRSRITALLSAAALAGCVVVDTGPVGADPFPRVEGRWSVHARVLSSGCGFVVDEPFSLRVIQNRDILQLVVRVAGFGEVRWDGRLERDGDFLVRHRTVFPDRAIRDESSVEGRFDVGGRRLAATEVEWITDLVTGDVCRIVWRWRGNRRR